MLQASDVAGYRDIDKPGVGKVVAEIRAAGGQAAAVQADVSKPAGIKKLFDGAEKAFGTADIPVNNAGVYGATPLGSISAEDYHRIFDSTPR